VERRVILWENHTRLRIDSGTSSALYVRSITSNTNTYIQTARETQWEGR
jgi:hypothetical protein